MKSKRTTAAAPLMLALLLPCLALLACGGSSDLNTPPGSDVSAPTALTATSVDANLIVLSWSAPISNTTVAYRIRRDGWLVYESTTTDYYDGSLNTHVRYCYTVSTVALTGAESAETAPVCATAGYMLDPAVSGIVTDAATMLTWTAASPSNPSAYTWYGAVAYCSSLSTGGLAWRLPVAAELSSLLIYPGVQPPYDASVFALSSSGGMLWSASDDPASYANASAISCNTGLGYYAPKSNSYGLLCVSDPQGGGGGAFGVPVTLDSPMVGMYSSLKVDGAGHTHIAYYDDANGYLKYATDASGVWAISVADNSGTAGLYASLALDAAGRPHVAYQDLLGGGQLKYAYMDGFGQWQIAVVDATPGAGADASLALDASGAAHISYADGTDAHLRYATDLGGGGWSIQSPDPTPYVGSGTGIAVDSTGGLHISYLDMNTEYLMYAGKPPGGSWSTKTIDSSTHFGFGTALALDASGNPRISAYDKVYFRLKFAARNSGIWSVQVADAASGTGMHSSMAVDAMGSVHIASYDGAGGTLRYAYLPMGVTGWQTATLDSSPNVGLNPSIALGTDGVPRISYYDGYNATLKFLLLN